MSNEIIVINFINPTDSDSQSQEVSIELDADKLLEIYGDTKTVFTPPESAYLKVMSYPKGIHLDIDSSAGDIIARGTNIPFSVDENIVFSNSTEASLTHHPDPRSAISYTWIGRGSDESTIFKPQFNDKAVTIQSPHTGVLNCKYTAFFSRYELTMSCRDMLSFLEMPVVVAVSSEDAAAFLEVNYEIEVIDPAVAKTYTVNVTSLCADGVLEGVVVTKDLVIIGTSDENGQITFDAVPGTYTFGATLAGYTYVSKEVILT